jgi:inositol polyphosphate 5-phosphatase INPP5J/K
LYVVTWNVSQKYPDHISLNDLLDVDSDMDKSLPDVYIVGLQEVNANPQNIVTNLFKSDPVSRSNFGTTRGNRLFAFPECETVS